MIPSSSNSTTPLPWRILIALLTTRIAEAACWQVIMPYINEQIASFGVPADQVGAISGTAESIFMVAEAVAAPFWGWAADHWPWKRAVSVGLFLAAALSTVYGLATSVWAVVFWRSVLGFSCGSTVTARIICAEACDESNMAQAFGIYSVGAFFGMFLAQLIGGLFCNITDKVAWLRGIYLLEAYPYLLPNLIVAAITLYAAYLVERDLPSTVMAKHTGESDQPQQKQTGLILVLKDKGMQAFFTLSFFTFLIWMAWGGLFPLFAFAPSPFGLSLEPSRIGLILAASAAVSTIDCTVIFPFIKKRIGVRLFLFLAFAAMTMSVTGLPVSGYLANRSGKTKIDGVTIWSLLGTFAFLNFGELVIVLLDAILSSVIPDPALLAPASAMAHSTAGIGKATGPVIMGYLFGYSMHGPTLRRWSIWIVYISFCLLATGFTLLPFNLVRDEHVDDKDHAEEGYRMLPTALEGSFGEQRPFRDEDGDFDAFPTSTSKADVAVRQA